MEKSKICTMCKRARPLDCFDYRGDNKQKKISFCKECNKKYKREWAQKRRHQNAQVIFLTEKVCPSCKLKLPISQFHKAKGNKDGARSYCKKCEANRTREWRHKTGKHRPMAENTDCSAYLGVNIAERILAVVFRNIQRMPYGYKGYDFVCAKNKKIDVKSSCIRVSGGKYRKWSFSINQNKNADYFLLIAFDHRQRLNPKHCWLISGTTINQKICLSITDSDRGLSKWSMYEQPLDQIVSCCEKLKGV